MLDDNKLDSMNPKPEDKLPLWLQITIFLVWPVGLIFYLVNFRKNPNQAKMAGILAIAGLTVGLILNYYIGM